MKNKKTLHVKQTIFCSYFYLLKVMKKNKIKINILNSK